MYAQAIQHIPVRTKLAKTRSVAVLLNANARRVTPRTVTALQSALGKENVFLSRSESDAQRLVNQVLDGGFEAVFLGGGDGTIICFVNEFLNQVARRKVGRPVEMPRLGILKLGTGNSVASWVNASESRGDLLVDDVLRAKQGQVPNTRTLELIEIDGQRTPFAGLGLDGKLLNDYLWIKNNLGQGAFKKVMSGPGGYLTSVALRTVPYYLSHSTAVECEVVNSGSSDAFRLDPHGEPTGKPIAPGEVLFSGQLMMAAAGTVPFYGYQLRTFPFAGKRRGMMHLRLGNVAAASALANLTKLWKGTWFPKGLHDFHAADVSVHFARPMPLQIAGDAAGERESLRMAIAKESLEVFDFNRSAEVLSLSRAQTPVLG